MRRPRALHYISGIFSSTSILSVRLIASEFVGLELVDYLQTTMGRAKVLVIVCVVLGNCIVSQQQKVDECDGDSDRETSSSTLISSELLHSMLLSIGDVCIGCSEVATPAPVKGCGKILGVDRLARC